MLREVVDIARSQKTRVLVNEAYLDAVYEDTPQTAYHLGPEVIVTSGLTKIYGLSGLRCGWILAALRHLQPIRERARRIVERDLAALDRFVTAPRTKFGATAFLRIVQGNVDHFLERLRAEQDTSAAPGRSLQRLASAQA